MVLSGERGETVRQEEEAERVVKTYAKLMTSIVRAILGTSGSAEDVEECVQDVFAEYLRPPQKLDELRGNEKTYLCVLARSRARSLRARLAAHAAVPLEEELLLAAPDEMGRSEARAALRSALMGLGSEERQLFTLRFVYEWDTKSIARRLGVTQSAVTTRTARLRERLKKLLALQGIELEEMEGRRCTE